MPKIKTHRGAAKRFSVTKNGRIKRAKAYKRHLLNGKTTKRTRKLRHATYVVAAEEKNIKQLIPYK